MSVNGIEALLGLLKQIDEDPTNGNNNGKYLDTEQEVSIFNQKTKEYLLTNKCTNEDVLAIRNTYLNGNASQTAPVTAYVEKSAEALEDEFEPIKLGFMGVICDNGVVHCDEDHSGTINTQKELDNLYKEADRYTNRYINSMIEKGREATKKLQEFLTSRDSSQYHYEYSVATGIEYNDGSWSDEEVEIAKSCDTDKSGIIEGGKELSKFAKAVKERFGYTTIMNGTNDALTDYYVRELPKDKGYEATCFINTYVVDNETGEKVLYNRNLSSSYIYDKNGEETFSMVSM